jgi:hypothetical protein
MNDPQDRRGFLARMTAAGAALWAATLTGACEMVGLSDPDDDFAMHGPVRENTKVLSLPEAPSARDLFTPYHDGRPFLRRWAIGHIAQGSRGQFTVLVVDLDSGGHAELDLFARDPSMHPVAHSRYFDLIIDNGEQGSGKTPPHLERLAERLAEIISSNEAYLPELRTVPKLKDVAPSLEAETLSLLQDA